LFLETWPKWGSMQNGECWGRVAQVHHTHGNVSGLWHTPRKQCTRLCRPRTQDYTRNGENGNLEEQVVVRMGLDRGYLNPVWIEWLMGWPIGWTALEPLETAKFQQWLHSHGGL